MRDLRDAVSLHQLVLAANNASPATLKQYMGNEVRFLAYLERKRFGLGLEELNPNRVREYLIWYHNQAHPHRSRGGEVAVRTAADILKRLGRVLEDNEYLPDNPLRKLRRPKVSKFTRSPYSVQELSALRGAAIRGDQGERETAFATFLRARDEAVVLLLLDSGMRIGELCSLRLTSVDLDRHTVTVMGKGRRERVIPIGNSDKRDGGRVVRALRRYLMVRESTARGQSGNQVFLARDGRPLTPSGGNDLIKRLAERGGVQDAYPHRFRHTFCTHYLTIHPGDELGLRRIVGHISQDVLADYVHLASTTIAQRHGQASIAESLLG